jgi:hypothetical protein
MRSLRRGPWVLRFEAQWSVPFQGNDGKRNRLWVESDEVDIFLSGGDHPPRHVHVSDSGGKLLGRVVIETLQPLDDWTPPRKVLEIIEQLRQEDRL